MSYQWNVGAEHCSCIVFVDRDTAPKTIAQWENPVDTTANLAALATSGHLEIIQIVNRQLPTLPEQLRKCHHLKEFILIYTKTISFPDWATEFTKLEYLHIQGDLTSKQLTYLPRNLFGDMTHLLFLHLGSLVKLPYVPDLSSLKRLEYLGLGMLHSVTEVPSLQNLAHLRRVSIIDAIRLYSLPPTHHLRRLKTFALTAREPMCCNGYITGKCDLTDFSCRNRTASGEPLVTCTSQRVDPLDYKVITSTNGIVCEKNLTFDLKDVKPTLAATDVACGGILYMQCALKGVQGMCFPTRMMAVSCQINKNYIAMRRLQIQRKVGDKCNPAVEHWLGCVA